MCLISLRMCGTVSYMSKVSFKQNLDYKRTLSMSTESSANHCLASFCCTTQATCRQAVGGKVVTDHVTFNKSYVKLQ